MLRLVSVLALLGSVLALAVAVPPEAGQVAKGKKKFDTAATDAAKRATLEKGLRAEVWAAEPDLANPVVFTFDNKGAAYVVETYRHSDGVTDTRSHMYWLEDDIGCRTVADRLAMYQKHKFPAYEKFGEQLRKVWDSSGSGHADKSSVFSGPYNKPEDGVAAGVLARKGSVYFGCIPDLYLLKDTKGTNTADVKQSLITGFGIHVQFIGHDLHGLIIGPDGKLYMSVGDRGFNITTKEGKKLFNPDSGAVLRCDLDGSNLEVIHVGLRNPQELAFDELGNLFTYDNNSDSGDQARWVHIVPGGDSGWRCGYQYGTLMHHAGVPQGNRGPWNTEKLWHTQTPEQPAYVVPPLKHFGNGPSGITYYPGIGLNERYQGHFFATDFTANPGNSTIWSLALKPKGASFEVVDLHPFIRNMVPTDCEFGPDGAFYWLDWTGGWDKPKKGRIFRVTDDEAMKSPRILETKTLLAEGFEKQKSENLLELLAHPHMKVRQEAQLELVGRVKKSDGSPDQQLISKISKIATGNPNKLARLHALWAMATVSRGFPTSADLLVDSLMDKDADIRIAAAKTVASAKTQRKLIVDQLSRETDLRVQAELLRILATYSIQSDELNTAAKVGLAILQKNNDTDPHLRQAAAHYLASLTDQPCQLIETWKASGEAFNTSAVRLGLVLALRKLQCPKLGDFVNDSEPRVAAEAGRAIYDQEIQAAMLDLAKQADKSGLPDAVAYRALAANFRIGDADALARVVGFAGRNSEAAHLREAALKLLGDWAKPKRLDPITGLTMTLPERAKEPVVQAVKAAIPKLLNGPEAVRREAIQEIGKLGIPGVGPQLAAIVSDSKQQASARAEALYAMEAIKASELQATAKAALSSDQTKLKAAARAILAKADPNAGEVIPKILAEASTSIPERQALISIMGTYAQSKAIDEALLKLLQDYREGKLSEELKLDVMEAAEKRINTKKMQVNLKELSDQITRETRGQMAKDPLAQYRNLLQGGDAEQGRSTFLNNAAVYCQRCHKLDGQGGEVGPVMNGIAAKQTREYLLESIIYPNAKIAQGFQSVILNLADGRTVSGVLKEKTAKQYTLVTADNKVLTIPKDDVDSEKPDKSAMPDDLHKKISKRELRDLVEFLSRLK